MVLQKALWVLAIVQQFHETTEFTSLIAMLLAMIDLNGGAGWSQKIFDTHMQLQIVPTLQSKQISVNAMCFFWYPRKWSLV